MLITTYKKVSEMLIFTFIWIILMGVIVLLLEYRFSLLYPPLFLSNLQNKQRFFLEMLLFLITVLFIFALYFTDLHPHCGWIFSVPVILWWATQIILESITLSSKRPLPCGLVLGLWLKTQNQAWLLVLVQRKTTTPRQWIFYLATGSPATFSDHRQC